VETSTYYDEDNYSSEELEEHIEWGVNAYCEVTQHYDWSDNIHGFPTLLAGNGEWVSCCDGCGRMFAEQIVEEALGAGLTGIEIVARVRAHFEEGNYHDVLANQIVTALRAPNPRGR
jgi:hypothetical protein